MPRLILGLMLCAAAGGLAAQQLNEVQAIKLGERIVELEVARTSVEHRTGLMHREAMPENHGMLFIFAAPRPIAMWMKNTLMDLDAAFVDECGSITQIVTMKTGTLDLHHSRVDTSRVIEMNAGWFHRHDVKVGTQIDSLSDPAYCRAPAGEGAAVEQPETP